jgi:hypothetical protein
VNNTDLQLLPDLLLRELQFLDPGVNHLKPESQCVLRVREPLGETLKIDVAAPVVGNVE